MRVLYGVCGEGQGHARRSARVASRLAARGHEVIFATSASVSSILRPVGRVVEIPSPSLAFSSGSLDVFQSALKNLLYVATSEHAFDELAQLQPDAVVTDCEPITARVAGRLGCMLVELDNIYSLALREIVGAVDPMWRAIVEQVAPDADLRIVPTLDPVDVTEHGVYTCRAGLRDGLKRPSRLGHWAAYLSYDLTKEMYAVLRASPRTVYVFTRKGCDGWDGQACYVADRERFGSCLASSSGVVASAGFELMAECIALYKPLLAIPASNHVEQAANAAFASSRGLCLVSGGLTAHDLLRLRDGEDELHRVLSHRIDARPSDAYVLERLLC